MSISLLRLAFKNILRSKIRTGFTLLALATGVAGMSIASGFIEDIYNQFREDIIRSQYGHFQIFKKGFNELGRQRPFEYLMSPDPTLFKSISQLSEVKILAKRLVFSGLLSNGEADYPIYGEGIEPDKELKISEILNILSGRNLTSKDKYKAIVGEGVAVAMNLKVGEYISMFVNSPEGAMNLLDFEVVGVFSSASKIYDNRGVRLPLSAAQKLLNTKQIHSFVGLLTHTQDTLKVTQQINQNILPSDLEIQPWEMLASFYRKTVLLFDRQYGILQGALLLMIFLVVNSTIAAGINERVKEIATMRAIGDSTNKVFKMLLIESICFSLLGSLLGIIMTFLLTYLINQNGINMPPPPNSSSGFISRIRLDNVMMIKAVLLISLSTVGATILPALKVIKINISEGLR